MKRLASSLALSLFLSAGIALADSPKDAPKDAAAASRTAQPAKPVAAKTSAEIAAEVDELRQTLQSQQKMLQVQQEELQLLKEELVKRDTQIAEARETAASANARASEATVKASEAATTSAEVRSTTTALNSTVSSLAASNATVMNSSTAANPQVQPANEEKGPTTIRFKGVSITPGGFLGADTVNRQHAESADVGTPFNWIPYAGNSTGHLTEMNFSARQSRLCLLFGAKAGSTTLSGYYEADFLGAGTTSNNRQTNSYVFRQRQLWGQAALANGLTFSGGQMWSLATEDRKGIALRQESLPVMIDPNYVVGFTWQRASAFRVTKAFNDKIAVAASVEGPQTTIGGRGFSTYTNTSATGVVNTYQNFFLNAPGLGGGFFNAFDPTGYTVNKLPDFLVKVAVDPGFGHYELFGILSDFRNRIYPCAVAGTTAKNFPTPADPTVISCNGSTTPSAALAYNNSSLGGGLGASAAESLLSKRLEVGLKVVAGDGIGRFGAAQLPDLTARPDGTLALIKNLQYLAKIEAHPTPKWDVYGYFGGEYDARAAYTGYTSIKIVNTPAIPGCGGVGQQPCSAPGTIQPSYPALATTTISTNGIGGYGSPYANNSGCSIEVAPAGTGTPGTGGACAGDTKYLFEATVGFWNKIYQGEKGRLQWGLQYSYFSRHGWSGSDGINTNPGIAPHAVDNMFWTSFRYYLP
jgi:hypothetical protein